MPSAPPSTLSAPSLRDANPPRRVLVWHRSRLCAEALKALIEQANRSFAVNAVSDDPTTETPGQDVSYDLAVIEFTELEATRRFASRNRDTAILMILPDERAFLARELIRCGTRGIALASMRGSIFTGILQLIAVGGTYVPSELDNVPAAAAGADPPPRPGRRAGRIGGLSARQVQVLELLGRGLSNKAIARQLALTENTVKTHVAQIIRRLGVKSRTSAALAAMRLGLLSR